MLLISSMSIAPFIIARPDCLSVVIVLLKYVFRRCNVLNDLLPSAEVTGECTKNAKKNLYVEEENGVAFSKGG